MSWVEQMREEHRRKGWRPNIQPASGRSMEDVLKNVEPLSDEEAEEFVRIIYEGHNEPEEVSPISEPDRS